MRLVKDLASALRGVVVGFLGRAGTGANLVGPGFLGPVGGGLLNVGLESVVGGPIDTDLTCGPGLSSLSALPWET